jgi:hypothetical protein
VTTKARRAQSCDHEEHEVATTNEHEGARYKMQDTRCKEISSRWGVGSKTTCDHEGHEEDTTKFFDGITG